MFSVKTYMDRRQRLKEQVGKGLILFLGNGESPMNYRDNTYHYRQDSTFLYFFGLSYAGLAAVIDVDSGKETIFGNELTVDDIVWMGTQPTIREKSQKIGVEQTAPLDKLGAVLQEAKSKGRAIHFLPPYRPEHFLQIFDLLDIHPSKITDSASVDLIKAVVAQRNIKSDEEIAEIDRACEVTADMHLAAYRMAKPGLTEFQIAAAVQEAAKASNCELAFPIIATIHGETLHNHYHGNTLKSGDMFLLDAGAETEMGYAGDMSSTMPVDPKFTDRQKEIYAIALAAHEAALRALKPGVLFKDVHLSAAKTIAQGMKELGFMKGDIDEAIAQGAHGLFFQCGTGHMMGLDVHDMENLGEQYVGYPDGMIKSTQFGLKSLRLGRKMEPRFVVTIEPGIYFIPELIDMWKSENKLADFINYDKVETYKDFGGIRNEEDCLITGDGCRILGKSIPKTIEEVEAIHST
jgi:Xaa-Pro aminopeptidase